MSMLPLEKLKLRKSKFTAHVHLLKLLHRAPGFEDNKKSLILMFKNVLYKKTTKEYIV